MHIFCHISMPTLKNGIRAQTLNCLGLNLACASSWKGGRSEAFNHPVLYILYTVKWIRK